VNVADLIKRAEEARTSWVDLEGGRRLKLHALVEGDIQDIAEHQGSPRAMQEAMLDLAVTGWDGFTEADIDPHGSDQPLPFDRVAFRYWYRCNSQHWAAIGEAIADATKAATEKLVSLRGKP
jgi:hypothetical protein